MEKIRELHSYLDLCKTKEELVDFTLKHLSDDIRNGLLIHVPPNVDMVEKVIKVIKSPIETVEMARSFLAWLVEAYEDVAIPPESRGL